MLICDLFLVVFDAFKDKKQDEQEIEGEKEERIKIRMNDIKKKEIREGRWGNVPCIYSTLAKFVELEHQISAKRILKNMCKLKRNKEIKQMCYLFTSLTEF